jgi:serine/threonine protein kinase
MNAIDQDDGASACGRLDTSRVVAALEEYQEALRSGRSVDRSAFLDAHDGVADRLSDYLDALDLIQSVAGEVTPELGSEMSQSPLGPGEILGDFRILREVGRGGMGVVYEAEELRIPARRVALKVLPATSGLEPRTLQRFRVETQAAACLNHPNIVPVFSAGCDRDTPFYAMPLIKGRSLAEILRTRREGDQTSTSMSLPTVPGQGPDCPWPVVVARLGLQVADALEHAHSLGVIHRDIKPSNLIVDAEGRLWVTDFGLARVACNEAGPTSTGDLVGTLRYMTPEQIRGEPGAGDPRSDIYALGVTLYEAVTLRPLFEASDRSALIHRILNDEPLAPRTIAPAVPRDLETIILKAMDKVPDGRYSTARALADDLRCFLEDRPIRARRPSIVERSLRWSRRHRALLATAVAGVVVSMAIGTFALWRAKLQAEAAKLQAEADVLKVNDAREKEFRAFHWAVGINDMVTVPLLREATVAGIWDQGRRVQSYQQLIGFYDWVVKTVAPEGQRAEMVAKASRRAGALRLILGNHRGLDDYDRAIHLYEAMSARTPDRIWYRADLISTLREYMSHLEKLGDHRATSARRRACEVAEGLLGDEAAKLKCFRMGVIPQFKALIEMLSKAPDATDSDRALAERLRVWIKENPEPDGPFIYLPRP